MRYWKTCYITCFIFVLIPLTLYGQELKNCRIFCSSPAIGNRGNVMLYLTNGINDL